MCLICRHERNCKMLFLPLLCYPVGNVTPSRDKMGLFRLSSLNVSTVDFHPRTCSLGVLPYPQLKHRPFRTSWSRINSVFVVVVYVQPDRSFSPPFKCLYLEHCNRLLSSTNHLLALYYTTYVPFYRSSYICSRPCTFIKSVALSSARALPSPLVRIIS